MHSSLFAAAIALMATPIQAETVFHFYGAEDCPPCMVFKRNHLADVITQGEANDFSVRENISARTRDVPNVGVYGEADAVLRDALGEDGIPYPPIFFVTEHGEVIAGPSPRWRDILSVAVDYGSVADRGEGQPQ